MPPTQKIIITRDIGEQALAILEQERADISLHVSPLSVHSMVG